MSLNISLVLQAIAAAALFGSSAPLAKLLLGRTEPLPLAGFIISGYTLNLIRFMELGYGVLLRIPPRKMTTNTPAIPIEKVWPTKAVIIESIFANGLCGTISP